MKKRSIVVCWLLFAVTGVRLNGAPLGTAFTYHGRLTEGANPASGSYYMYFTLHDALEGGNQVASQPTNTVFVSDGLFMLDLDFGDTAFTGSARWLQINVRTNAGVGVDLTPRTRIAPAPNAIYASRAGTVTNGAIQASQLGTDGAASAGQVLTYNGSSLAWQNPAAASGAWTVGGNNAAGGDFLGTLNNLPLEMRVNNSRALRLEPNAISPNVIAGWSGNSVAPGVTGGTIGGGGAANFFGLSASNRVVDDFCTIGGGAHNAAGTDNGNFADAFFATIGGGHFNHAEGISSTIGGGAENRAANNDTTVAGGYQNQAVNRRATVGGGQGNVASGEYSKIGGGVFNRAEGVSSTISGGAENRATNNDTTIGGGYLNSARALRATVGGGHQNDASGQYSTIAGGQNNTASGFGAAVAGGINNYAISLYSTVAGGQGNLVWGTNATIAGGSDNYISSAPSATISGGVTNISNAEGSAIGGGFGNQMGTSAFAAATGGGSRNIISHAFGTVGGGEDNKVVGYFPAFAGILQGHGTVSGGSGNTVAGPYCAVGGGSRNEASALRTNYYCFFEGCIPLGIYGNATVSGGDENVATGVFSTIPGGAKNWAPGDFTFAAGRRAKAASPGAFVWADSTDTDFWDSGTNSFSVRATGGVKFATTFLTVTGTGNEQAYLGGDAVGGDVQVGSLNPAINNVVMFNPSTGTCMDTYAKSFNPCSDRNLKENFTGIDTRAVLAKVVALPITKWNFKEDPIQHIGPVAQDFYSAFGVGADDKHIPTVDADGVALAAIQGLHEIVQDQRAQLKAQQERIDNLKARLIFLEKICSQYIAGK